MYVSLRRGCATLPRGEGGGMCALRRGEWTEESDRLMDRLALTGDGPVCDEREAHGHGRPSVSGRRCADGILIKPKVA